MTQGSAEQSDAERGALPDGFRAKAEYEAQRLYLAQPKSTVVNCFADGAEWGYAAGEAAQAGRFYDFERAVADALSIWQAQGSTVALVTRIRSALADLDP